jgi:ribosomal protein S19
MHRLYLLVYYLFSSPKHALLKRKVVSTFTAQFLHFPLHVHHLQLAPPLFLVGGPHSFRSKDNADTHTHTMRASLVALGRSSWKGPFVVPLPLAEAKKNGTPIRTNARSCTILPQFVGLKFQIHNGRNYVQVQITENMVGSKLGEFAHTRKRFSYTQTKNK